MTQFKPAKILMLPTTDVTDIAHQNYPNELFLSKGKHNFVEYQHLYVISDDEITEGWEGLAYKEDVVGQVFKHFYTKNPWYNDAKKIIATTDFLSYIKHNDTVPYPSGKQHIIPKLPKEFIEEFIGEYNKGNIITDVLVEYELSEFVHKTNPKIRFDANKEIPSFVSSKQEENLEPYYGKLIVNSDNIINIRKAKDAWNIEEVIAFGKKIKEYCKNGYKEDSLHRVFFDWDKWLKENL